ncbi:MAG TPA: L-threonylcarbamoyladenylate synthase [Thermoanaerobaculia bacterium]|jgi:L-threonylcarbamoyladenylate synthase|nr:L-threonylcarbamoyladenylate synthase [Thermoanaerobaculia bacterium]
MSPPAPLWRFGGPVAPLAALLARGGVLAIPTESSYGLAVPPGNAAGVAAIYRLKRRERGKPLPVVIAGLDQLAGLGIAPDLPILKLLSAFWPGPLTAVLPIAGAGAAGAPPAAAGTGTLAIRIPGHPQLVDLLSRLGHGLTATSANRSGGEPVLDPRQAAELLAGQPAMVVDGGVLPGGLPSTLIAPVAPAGPPDADDAGDPGAGWCVEVLRAGRLPVERLRERLRVVAAGAGTVPGAGRLC